MRLMEKSGQASDPSAEFVLTTMFHEMGQEYASLGAQLARRDSELTGPGTASGLRSVDHADYGCCRAPGLCGQLCVGFLQCWCVRQLTACKPRS